MATVDEILLLLTRMDQRLTDHIETETPVLDAARVLLDAHGGPEDSRARITFVNAWMRREAQREQLRQKVLGSALIWALIIALGFVGYAIRDAIVHYLNGVKITGP